MNTANIERYLNSFGKQVVNRSKGNLQKAKGGGTALEQSIKFKVESNADGFSVDFYMAYYGTFIDKGVSGTKIKRTFKNYLSKVGKSPYSYKPIKNHSQPPTGIIDKWVVKKSISGTRDKEGKFIKRKSLVFAIAKSIGEKGFKSLAFFQKPLGLGLKQFGKNLLESIEEDIVDTLTKTTVN